jgi:phage terminase large subunit
MSGDIRIELPDWHAELMLPHRYKVLYGGRGSGKSWTVARCLLLLAASKTLRVLCTREVQESIKDSVHRLLSDQIAGMGLGQQYEITRDEIRGLNGSLFIFSGLAQHTVESIKSFEGVDIVWCEEAQSIVKRSWDVLLPTIRKDSSEIWMTMNPCLETDETWQRFIENANPTSFVRQVNWRDNPWFSDVLDQERLETQRRDPDNYPNIWEGQPMRVAEGAIYRYEVDQLYTDGRVRQVPVDPILPVHTVWDLGWNDSMSIACVQRSASEVRVIDYLEGRNNTLDWYIRELEAKKYRWGTDFIPHDGKSKDFKTGKSTEEILRSMGRDVSVLQAHAVEESIRAARLLFPRCYFDATKTKRLLECLKRYRRTVAKNGEPMGPLHDEFSHGADCFRYIGQAVDRMKSGMRKPKKKTYEPIQSWMAG